MIATLWRVAAAGSAPGLRLMLRRRARRGKEIAARLPEREGIAAVPRPAGPVLWLHAASVGEAMSMLPVLSSLARQASSLSIVFTTGTVTSAELLARLLPELGLAQVRHQFVPLDVPAWAARFLDHWQPDLAVFVESELWPNLLAACRARGVRLMLVNGRMSARSLRRWRAAPGFAQTLIGAFDRVHAQSQEDTGRLESLGARGLVAPGNLKWAAPRLAVDEAELARLRGRLAGRPAWVAASTHPGEEALAAAVHGALAATYPGLVTIVAPRHPARGASVAAALHAARRTGADLPEAGGIWIVDTMGELGLLYRLAPVVFMGGSLVPHGGQNPLEPARFGCAIATGPHTQNFCEIVARLAQAGGLAVVEDGAALTRFVAAMLAEPERRIEAGRAAQGVADGEHSLPDRVAGEMLALLAP